MAHPTRLQLFAALSLLVLVLFPVSRKCTAQNYQRFVRWSYQDAGNLLNIIGPRAPIFVIAGGAMLTTGINIDEPFQDDVQESYASRGKGLWGGYLDFSNEFGGPGVRLPIAGLFAATLLSKNTKLQDAAFTSLQSWLYSGILSYGLKYAFGRYRPEDGFGPDRFQPFSSNTSFPSGHTVAAFALITPWVLYYPHPVTYSLFGISTGTAIARMARNKHWPTDVIAGAAIGFFVGRHLVRRHTGEATPTPAIKISSSASANSFAVTARW